jgi:hypothetical protein
MDAEQDFQPDAGRGVASDDQDRRVISAEDARQGVMLGVMRYVLMISMALVIAGFLVAWGLGRL